MILRVRPARARDADFLVDMLVAAAYWRPDGPRGSAADVLAQPELVHYVAEWPRPGDLGVIAEEDDEPVGAAWLRPLSASDPGYGFVDAATPELSIGVAEVWRARGVGRMLLDALIVAARANGVPAVSLSVERDNYARRLYDRAGVEQVGERGNSVTMVLRLDRLG